MQPKLSEYAKSVVVNSYMSAIVYYTQPNISLHQKIDIEKALVFENQNGVQILSATSFPQKDWMTEKIIQFLELPHTKKIHKYPWDNMRFLRALGRELFVARAFRFNSYIDELSPEYNRGLFQHICCQFPLINDVTYNAEKNTLQLEFTYPLSGVLFHEDEDEN
jgi:hypothetical protein